MKRSTVEYLDAELLPGATGAAERERQEDVNHVTVEQEEGEAGAGEQNDANDVTVQPNPHRVGFQHETWRSEETLPSVVHEKERYVAEMGFVRDALISRQDIYTYLALAPPISALAAARDLRLSHASQRPVLFRHVLLEHPRHYWILYWIISLTQIITPFGLLFYATYGGWEKFEGGDTFTLPFSYTVNTYIPLIALTRLLSGLLFLINFNNAIMDVMRQVYYREICKKFLDPVNRWLCPGQTEYSSTDGVTFIIEPLQTGKNTMRSILESCHLADSDPGRSKRANFRWRILKDGVFLNWMLTWSLTCVALPLILWLEEDPQDVILNSLAFNFILNLDDLGLTQQVLLFEKEHVDFCFAEVKKKFDLLCAKFEEACNKVIDTSGRAGFVKAYSRITDRRPLSSDCPKSLSRDEHAMLCSIVYILRSSWKHRQNAFIDRFVYAVAILITLTFCYPPYFMRSHFIGCCIVLYVALALLLSKWLGGWRWSPCIERWRASDLFWRLRRTDSSVESGGSSPISPAGPGTQLTPLAQAK
ncbi:unnamed protein product [Vitrella brassicaformis CCMP3155]|uniref:Uncharacterized protein n=1 Tax=Vitrella brassicaformis (strain CCMP3155) TaxID=1169540 RepID=A0A0G4GTV2_VITBC|nr:unnamed protein product [Vitrella brassicaformis CCMP3155]|eukprot:CEM34032.1 unnamed protein product [Vitrella brassicaformis CCMP3155]